MMRRTLSALVIAAVLIAGCAAPAKRSEMPTTAHDTVLLRLPPASLQRTLSLQQSIEVDYGVGGRREHRELQVLLEADAAHTRLAAIGGGQVLARLDWDGNDLKITRAPWAPDAVQPERILSDLQLSLWPAEAIRQALPQGWRLDDAPTERRLRQGDEVVMEIRYPDPATTLIEQRRDGYRLTIRTLPAATTGAGDQ